MRLTQSQIQTIKQATVDIFGPEARVWLFGSRVDDNKRGGDVDLLVEMSEPIDNPVNLGVRMAARVSKYMYGRRVDVLIKAPGLQEQAIHREARENGISL